MNVEIMNKIIKFMMDRPYKEVFELMGEVRAEVERLNAQAKDPIVEEVVDGN